MGSNHVSKKSKSLESRSSANQTSLNGKDGSSLKPPALQFARNGNLPIQRVGGLWDSVGDFLNLRENEAQLDAYEDYMDSRKAKKEFSSQTHSKLNHRPSTGRGKFDAHYYPPKNELIIAIRYSLNFIDGSATKYPDAKAEELKWTAESKAHWEKKMKAKIYATWSGKFTFHCQKKYWEDLSAATSVVAYKDDSKPHFNFNVTKIPVYDKSGKLTKSTSSVTPPTSASKASKATFDSNDILEHDKLKTGKNKQVPIVHETGHILGLGDEYKAKSSKTGLPKNYTTADPNHMKSGYGHEPLVKKHFKTKVKVGRDSRIMSSGDQVQQEHGVTFLEALQKATGMEEWGYKFKPPAKIPRNPGKSQFNDGIVPKGDTKYA